MKQHLNRWLCVALAACAASLSLMLWTLRPQPTFTPPPFDAAAIAGTPQDLPPELGYAALDATAYQLALCGAPAVEQGSALLYLTNPAENAVWLKVRLYAADGTLLGESGLLRPGEYLTAVPLEVQPAESCPVTLKVMAYEPETYRSAGAVALNTTLNVP